MATALSLIKGSLRLIGALAEGEEPSADAASDALTALKGWIESENNNALTIYQIQDEVFTLVAGSVSQTIGPGGDFNTTWPTVILDSTFTRNTVSAPNVDFQVAIINNDQYSSIPVKTITGPYPQYIYYDRAFPLGSIFFWPVPIANLELHLSTWKPLTNFVGLTTEVNLPPGYDRFIRYGLAMELAPEYGVEPSPQVQRIAAKSRQAIQRVNNKSLVMSMPSGLPGMGEPWSYYSIYRGMP